MFFNDMPKKAVAYCRVSTLAKVLEVKKSFFAALPYQACQRKKRVCKKK